MLQMSLYEEKKVSRFHTKVEKILDHAQFYVTRKKATLLFFYQKKRHVMLLISQRNKHCSLFQMLNT